MVPVSRRRALSLAGTAVGALALPASAARAADPPSTQWVRTYARETDAPRRDPAACVRLGDGYGVVGTVSEAARPFLVTTAADGATRTATTVDTEHDHLVQSAVGADGRVLLATRSPTDSGSYMGLVGVDADGTVAFERRFGLQVDTTTPAALLDLPDGGVMLVGVTIGRGVHLFEADVEGGVLARQTFPFDTSKFYLFDAGLAADGDVYVFGGWEQRTSHTPVDVARLARDGTTVWRNRYATDLDVLTGALVSPSAGGVLLAYNEVADGEWRSRYHRIDDAGTESWRGAVREDELVRTLVAVDRGTERRDTVFAGGRTTPESPFFLGADPASDSPSWTGTPSFSGVGGVRDLLATGDGRVLSVCDTVRPARAENRDVAMLMLADENRRPTPRIDVSPADPAPDETVTLSAADSTDSDGWLTAYQWDFGDDGSVDATGESVTATFSTATTVRLTVVDAGGASASTTTTVAVQTPTATPTDTPTAGPGTESPASTTTSGPGMGVLAALGGVAGGVLARHRRRDAGDDED